VTAWFPKPADARDLRLVSTQAGFSVTALFALLHQPDAIEWRSKVGVAGRLDGSGKATTRLLAAGDWVLKTDVARAWDSADELVDELARLEALARRTGLWHPTKQWAVMRGESGWLPLSICRKLVTLRALAPLAARLEAWTKMIAFGVGANLERGVGLDLNPANFGFEEPGGRLYYLDDETTPRLGRAELASAVAARLPEEPDTAELETWRAWGQELRGVLVPLCGPDLSELVDELRRYPLLPRFASRLEALIDGLTPAAASSPRPPATRRAPALTCVLADVHGNLPALEAVLTAAEASGADSYLFLGDAVGYGPWPAECVARLAELPQAVWVRGNHDHAAATGEISLGMNRLARLTATWTAAQLSAADRAWLAALPPEHREPGWLAVHGAPKDPHRFFAYVYELTYEENLAHLAELRVPICFYGHTHVPFVHERSALGVARKLGAPSAWEPAWQPRAGEVALVNPGSVGQPRDGDPRAAFALWHRRSQRVAFRRIPYPIERTLRAIRANDLPEELLARLEAGR
jgi:diadenosine tetraphosphatase ApaH/serine/threonine PP2A family protein phosphatase